MYMMDDFTKKVEHSILATINIEANNLYNICLNIQLGFTMKTAHAAARRWTLPLYLICMQNK